MVLLWDDRASFELAAVSTVPVSKGFVSLCFPFGCTLKKLKGFEYFSEVV